MLIDKVCIVCKDNDNKKYLVVPKIAWRKASKLFPAGYRYELSKYELVQEHEMVEIVPTKSKYAGIIRVTNKIDSVDLYNMQCRMRESIYSMQNIYYYKLKEFLQDNNLTIVFID